MDFLVPNIHQLGVLTPFLLFRLQDILIICSDGLTGIKEAISYAQVSLQGLREFDVPVTPATIYIEMDALMYEYTGKQILQEVKKL